SYLKSNEAKPKPERYAIMGTSGEGAAFAGRALGPVRAFMKQVNEADVNTERIPVCELLKHLARTLGAESNAIGMWDAYLPNPRYWGGTAVVGLHQLDKLRTVLSGLSEDTRSHFFAKAQGAELGELGWYFKGREAETAQLSSWLKTATSGLKVITGDAGVGKSAFLGLMATLSDRQLFEALSQLGWTDDRALSPRPPSDVFDAVLHLRGQTIFDVNAKLRVQLSEVTNGAISAKGEVATLLADIKAIERPVTVLVDALDEAADPLGLAADLLRPLSALPQVRLVAGTRRSLDEDVDRPDAQPRTDVLDALNADTSELLVLHSEQEPIREYATHRLSDAGFADTETTRLAESIAAQDQPILFARLACSILAQDAPRAPGDEELAELLGHGHRGLFARAVAHLGHDDPAFEVVLWALSLARGRGMPRSTLNAIASGLAKETGVSFNSDSVDRALAAAAAYVVTDAEAGFGVYRLAHQTFVEHFRRDPDSQPRLAHGQVGSIIRSRNETATPAWSDATYYEARYVVEHFTLAEEHGQWSGSVDELAVDGNWLARAVELVGLEQVVDTLLTAHRRISASGGTSKSWVKIVARAIRRSRDSAGVDSRRLGPMLHARLANYDDQISLTGLGARIVERLETPWLQMTGGSMSSDDLGAKYAAADTVRALAFGWSPADGKEDRAPLVAIGIDKRIELWDPRTARPNESKTIQLDIRPVALGFFERRGKLALAVASYESDIKLLTLSGEDIDFNTESTPGNVTSIAVGTVGDKMTIGAVDRGGALWLWALDGQALPVTDALGEGDFHGVSVLDGVLVGHRVKRLTNGDGAEAQVLRLGDRAILGSTRLNLRVFEAIGLMDATEIDGRVIVIAAVADHFRLWDPAIDDLVAWESPYGNKTIEEMRTVAIGQTDGEAVAVSSRHLHGLAVVQLTQVTGLGDRSATSANIDSYDELGNEDGDQIAESLPPIPQPRPITPGAEQRIVAVIPSHSVDVERFETWPRTMHRRMWVEGYNLVATGSRAGSAFLWNLSDDPAHIVAGPFRNVEAHLLTLTVKNSRHTRDVDAANHPDLGLLVAIADGDVAVFTADGDQELNIMVHDPG
ncbi:MAG: ATP-binding protein, partial [Acidimicrobiia bacterium]|nr:ATP-binding protein [Acidimicrobiia bacterium]